MGYVEPEGIAYIYISSLKQKNQLKSYKVLRIKKLNNPVLNIYINEVDKGGTFKKKKQKGYNLKTSADEEKKNPFQNNYTNFQVVQKKISISDSGRATSGP